MVIQYRKLVEMLYSYHKIVFVPYQQRIEWGILTQPLYQKTYRMTFRILFKTTNTFRVSLFHQKHNTEFLGILTALQKQTHVDLLELKSQDNQGLNFIGGRLQASVQGLQPIQLKVEWKQPYLQIQMDIFINWNQGMTLMGII